MSFLLLSTCSGVGGVAGSRLPAAGCWRMAYGWRRCGWELWARARPCHARRGATELVLTATAQTDTDGEEAQTGSSLRDKGRWPGATAAKPRGQGSSRPGRRRCVHAPRPGRAAGGTIGRGGLVPRWPSTGIVCAKAMEARRRGRRLAAAGTGDAQLPAAGWGVDCPRPPRAVAPSCRPPWRAVAPCDRRASWQRARRGLGSRPFHSHRTSAYVQLCELRGLRAGAEAFEAKTAQHSAGGQNRSLLIATAMCSVRDATLMDHTAVSTGRTCGAGGGELQTRDSLPQPLQPAGCVPLERANSVQVDAQGR